jgi:hypothetical protein
MHADLENLNALIPVSFARVVVEHQANCSPPFKASASLSIPGPDLYASASDHTLAAAWFKVRASLLDQMQHRKSKQLRRRKLHLNSRLRRVGS